MVSLGCLIFPLISVLVSSSTNKARSLLPGRIVNQILLASGASRVGRN